MDILWWKKGDTLIPVLLFVDILSRKLWAFVLSKSKDNTRGENIVECIDKIKPLPKLDESIESVPKLEGE